MSKLKIFCAALFMVSVTAPLHAAIDSTLYASYFYSYDRVNLYFTVCGTLPPGTGCYGFETLGPFGSAGAILEGNASVNLKTNTVTRAIYVLDVAYGAGGKGVALYVYKRTDAIVASYDNVAVTLQKVVPLPLSGGGGTLASMAANAKFVYIGTNQGSGLVRLQKSNLTYTQPVGFLGGVAGITADKNGHVAVSWGSFNTTAPGGVIVYDANGNSLSDGGGTGLLLNTTQAILPAELP